jgi:hypothetical protein
MSAPIRRRRSTAAAMALTAGITAGAALMLSACGPEDTTGSDATPSASSSSGATSTGSAAPGSDGTPASGSGADGTAKPAASVRPAGSAAPLNGTAHNGLTISDGSRYVVMSGTRVDFGTQVRDLSWSPDGRKAAFIDGDGDLAVSNPDGSGRVVAARNPGDQNWSHPTWMVRPADPSVGYPAASNLILAVRSGTTTQLRFVPTTAHDATPKLLPLEHESGEGVPPLPQTGNVWPSSAGVHGTSVYANQSTGDVYLRDDYLRQQGFDLAKGSEPALSAQEDIVFVRSVGGHDHLFLEHPTDNGPTYRDLTPHATADYTEPAWSPDGRTIAARTTQGVVTLPADGSHAPVVTSGYHGLPAYRAS